MDNTTKSLASKKLFSISELCELMKITPRALRLYEDKGLITPSRAGAHRIYTHKDKARLVLILRGKRLGFTLRQIQEYLELYEVDPTQIAQTRRLLTTVNLHIKQLNAKQQAIQDTLTELHQIARQCEDKLEQEAQTSTRIAQSLNHNHEGATD